MKDICHITEDGSLGIAVPEPAQDALLHACNFEADMREGVRNSPHREMFQEALYAAVQQDRMVESAETLGYIRDPTSQGSEAYYYRSAGLTTYNGIVP